MVWRVLRCPSKWGISSLCCSCDFPACWVGDVSTQYLDMMRCISRLFGCMSLNCIARGYGLAAPSARLSRATLLAWLADVVWYVFVRYRLVCGCLVGETMIAPGLLNFCRCCALSLEGKSQVGIIPICVSSEGRMMPCCTIFSRLPMSACASSRHAPCVLYRIAFKLVCPAALCLFIIILFIMGWLQPDSMW